MLLFSKANLSVVLLPWLFANGETNYPLGISNCHLSSWFDSPPQRSIVASSGSLEIMLSLGLVDRISASCWVKEVWAPLDPDFQKFKHYDKYPTHEEMFGYKPDFIYGTYSSAFDASRINYTEALGIDECSMVVPTNVYGTNKSYCREDLHNFGIQTYLQTTYCELTEDRPEDVSVDDLYQEIWDIGAIFNVMDRARLLINGVEDDFALAKAVASAKTSSIATSDVQPLRVFWFDMYNGTNNPTPEDPQPYVGACCGGPQIILDHAGATNVFEKRGLEDRRIWDYAKIEEIVDTDPDLIVLVELSSESAAKKLHFLCTDPRTRTMRAVQERSFLVVPFAATNLGVRLGALAYNFAEAMASLARGTKLNALQFAANEKEFEAISKSGAKVWTKLPTFEGIDLETLCPGAPKTFEIQSLTEAQEAGLQESYATNNNNNDGLPGWITGVFGIAALGGVFIAIFLGMMVQREKNGEPMFAPITMKVENKPIKEVEGESTKKVEEESA